MRHRYFVTCRKNKGASMNKLLTTLFAVALLSGCGQSEQPAEAPAAPQASEVAEAIAPSAPLNVPVVDYVWNSVIIWLISITHFLFLIITGSCLKTIRSRGCHCNNRQVFEVALETSHRPNGLCVILGLTTILVMRRFS